MSSLAWVQQNVCHVTSVKEEMLLNRVSDARCFARFEPCLLEWAVLAATAALRKALMLAAVRRLSYTSDRR